MGFAVFPRVTAVVLFEGGDAGTGHEGFVAPQRIEYFGECRTVMDSFG